MSLIAPHCRRLNRHADEAGQATVEFALVLPVLLVILLGILDFGRALNYWNDANQIAGEGARYAAVNRIPGGGSSLKDYLAAQAMPELRDGSDSVDAAEVCINLPNGSAVGEPVQVTVTSSMSLIPFLGDAIGVGSVDIKGDATMRLEQTPTAIDTGCT